MRPKTIKPWSRDPGPGIAVLFVGVVLAGLLILTASILFFPAFQEFDARLTAVMRAADPAPLESLARALSFVGDRWSMAVLTALGAAWLFVRRMPVEAVLLGATMVFGTLAGSVLKELIERARPGIEYARIPVPESYSFPSGHALAAFLFFGIVAFIFFTRADSPRLKIRAWVACSLMALGVAIARVYLGVHFLGDIIASWMLGSAFLTASVGVYVWWVTREARDRRATRAEA